MTTIELREMEAARLQRRVELLLPRLLARIDRHRRGVARLSAKRLIADLVELVAIDDERMAFIERMSLEFPEYFKPGECGPAALPCRGTLDEMLRFVRRTGQVPL